MASALRLGSAISTICPQVSPATHCISHEWPPQHLPVSRPCHVGFTSDNVLSGSEDVFRSPKEERRIFRARSSTGPCAGSGQGNSRYKSHSVNNWEAVSGCAAKNVRTTRQLSSPIAAAVSATSLSSSTSDYCGGSFGGVIERHSHKSVAPKLHSALGPVTAGAEVLAKPWKVSDARLALEDGSVWTGSAFGAKGTQVGEVVFNTSLTGYQEILTDPSYAGQFVLMTQPHIGNTGVNLGDVESKKCFLGALVIRSLSISVSNWQATQSLEDYLVEHNVMGIEGLDTRSITKRLREDGSLIGVLSTDSSLTNEELIASAKNWDIVGKDLITGVSCTRPYEWKETTGKDWEFSTLVPDGKSATGKFHVVAYDFGIKRNIMRRLVAYGCRITVVPSMTTAEEVLALNPDGILFSNGPGDPSAVPYAVESAKKLIGKVPVFGICMGHQILGQAFGGRTFKMKFGHHGGNHPVRHTPTGRIEISSQNHNYAVDIASLPEGVEVTHVNLNDGTCAGMTYPAMKAMTIQYHPEASPGPHDSDLAFHDFVKMMGENRDERK